MAKIFVASKTVGEERMNKVTKPIKIFFTAPNGKQYSDKVNMTLEQYETFVNELLRIKKENE